MGEETTTQAELMKMWGVLETNDTSELNTLLDCGGKLIATATHLVDGHEFVVYSIGFAGETNQELPNWAIRALS